METGERQKTERWRSVRERQKKEERENTVYGMPVTFCNQSPIHPCEEGMLVLTSQVRKIGNFENMSRKSQGHSSNSDVPDSTTPPWEAREKTESQNMTGKGSGRAESAAELLRGKARLTAFHVPRRGCSR